MAFQLRFGESPKAGLRRLARKELAVAAKQVDGSGPPTEEAIHEARKSLKKVRAILRLTADSGGSGRLSRCERRLHDIDRSLSCLRDADAMIETLGVLKKHHSELFSEHVYARIRRQLVERKRAAVHEAGRGAWADTAATLRDIRRTARRWRPGSKGFAALEPGIRKTHRRARKALAKARTTNDAADFHEWRKQIKALWYQLRLVGSGTAATARDLRALRSAERWLGDDHNLVVLCEQLSQDPSVCRGPLDVQRLQCAVDTTQRTIRKKAIARTHTIFALKPRAYAARIERAWHARRRATAPAARRRAA